MSIIRYSTPVFHGWTPFNRLTTLPSELDRLFDLGSPALSGWTPTLDLIEEPDSFVVQVEVPGVKPEDVRLELKEGVLTIAGERLPTASAGKGQASRSERHYGKFERSVTLPSVVDAPKVKASYQNGVLTVTLPKAEEAKPRKIEVHVG